MVKKIFALVALTVLLLSCFSCFFAPAFATAPTPTFNPANRPTETLNLYFRSDSYTACGVSAYGLDNDYTNVDITIPVSSGSVVNVSYGIRVYVVTSASISTELTAGSPYSLVTLGTNFTGLLSSSWSCPSTATILGFQALKIDVYVSLDNGVSWTVLASYISNVVMTNRLVASTWGFNLYLNMSQTASTTCSFRFGDTTYRSGITNVAFETPFESELELWRINRGDYVGFEVGAYVDVIGEAFYALIMLLIAGVLFFRYGHFGTVAFFFVLFGGSGGLAWLFIPAWAAAVTSALLILFTSFLVWRVIR